MPSLCRSIIVQASPQPREGFVLGWIVDLYSGALHVMQHLLQHD